MFSALPWDRAVQRYVSRAENSGERLALSLEAAGFTWLWILSSVAVFLLVVSMAATLDLRMLGLLRHGIGEFTAYLFRGGRMFFRLFRDRQTPHYARLVPVAGLLYWLLPFDLIADESIVPGFLEDIVVAISSAKAFVYLCPDGVIARHASSVRASEPDFS